MNVRHLKDVRPMQEKLTCPYIKKCFIETVSMSDGKVIFHLEIDQKYYYELLSEWMGMPVKGRLRFFTGFFANCRKIRQHIQRYHRRWNLPEPKDTAWWHRRKRRCFWSLRCSFKHGNRYGFKIKAKAPSIHMIKAGIETEIAPIVGDQAQAEELITSMNNSQEQDSESHLGIH